MESIPNPLLPKPSKHYTKKWLRFRHALPLSSSFPEGGLVLYDNVDYEDWKKFATALALIEKHRISYPLRFLRYDKTLSCIRVVDLSTNIHEKWEFWIVTQLVKQEHNELQGIGHTTAEYIQKEPDSSYIPIGLKVSDRFPRMQRDGGAYPTLIVEYGHFETLEQLRMDALLWLLPPSTVQVVLLVKIIYVRESRKTDFVVEMYFREDVTDETTLGTPRVSKQFGDSEKIPRKGMPEFMAHIPGHILYLGDPILETRPLPEPVANGLTLDLYALQKRSEMDR
jgi:hypothetical protein